MKLNSITEILQESLRLDEDFWNPGKEFMDFQHLLYNEFDESDWNDWDQTQRDAFAEKVAKRYLEINPTPTPMFYEDLTDNNFHTYRKAFEKLLSLKESVKLTEGAKRVAQISFDIMYDPDSDEPNSQPDDIMSGFEWELEHGLEGVELLGSNIEDITGVYSQHYKDDFPELDESTKIDEARQPRSIYHINKRELIDWLSDHDQAFEDICNFFHIDANDEYCDEELAHYQLSDLLNWISDHEQLYDDMLGHFGLSGMVESLTESIEDYDLDDPNWDGIFPPELLLDKSTLIPNIQEAKKLSKYMKDYYYDDPWNTLRQALRYYDIDDVYREMNGEYKESVKL